MKRFFSILTATVLMSCFTAGALANFSVLRAFQVNTPNASCPPPGAKNVGIPTGQPSSTWCSAYLDQAVLMCTAGCQPIRTSCNRNHLKQLIVQNVASAILHCQQEKRYNPTVTVQDCVSEWQVFAKYCS